MSVIIRLQNLPMSANASNIRRFFGGLTIPEGGVHIVGGSHGDAFIAFATDEDARKAMLLDQQAINGTPIRLFLSSKTEMQSIIDSARSSVLFSNTSTVQRSGQQPVASIVQKTETMQALDVTAPTLPSSFPSYRNGTLRDSYPDDARANQYPYDEDLPNIDVNHTNLVSQSESMVSTQPSFEPQLRVDPYVNAEDRSLPLPATHRGSERPHPGQQPQTGRLPPPDNQREFDFERPYGRYDDPRAGSTRSYGHSLPPPHQVSSSGDAISAYDNSRLSPRRPYYDTESNYDRHLSAGDHPNSRHRFSSHPSSFISPTESSRFSEIQSREDVSRVPHSADQRYDSGLYRDNELTLGKPYPNRFGPTHDPQTPELRSLPVVDVEHPHPIIDRRSSGGGPYQNVLHYERDPSVVHQPPMANAPFRPPVVLSSQDERDFSVRPPWLTDEFGGAPKRPYSNQVDVEEYARKRRPLPPQSPQHQQRSTGELTTSETEFIVRVTLPIQDVDMKTIFEILRGVQIVSKWGIRIEEDYLQRPTGYVFIMLATKDSYDRALSYTDRIHRNKPIKVMSSTITEFYSVSDVSFINKCPPEIAKKLNQLPASSPPYYMDGCLEVAELPPDTTRAEIVRFIGAPGLEISDVVVAYFAPTDKTAPKSHNSVRALVKLPSAKDIEILLSAKPRPLRPDGAYPPVRLTAISKPQLDAYSIFSVDDPVIETPPKSSVPTPKANPIEPSKVTAASASSTPPLTCLHLSGLSSYTKDAEVHRLFQTVLIPGDAIHMIGPDNTSAYVDFISENNCRRALTDINGVGSKAKVAHPNLHTEALSHPEMEIRIEAHRSNGEGSLSESNLGTRTVLPTSESSSPSVPRPPSDHELPREHNRAHAWDSRPSSSDPAPLPPTQHSSAPPRSSGNPSQRPPFRPRSPAHSYGGPLSNQRQRYDDSYYDRPGPPSAPRPYDDSYTAGGQSMRRPPRPPMDPPFPQHGLPSSRSGNGGDYMGPQRPMDGPPPQAPVPLPPPQHRMNMDLITIRMVNLPISITVEQLADVFRDYYFIPGSIRVRRDMQGVPTGEGLVDFQSTYDSDRAIRELHGFRLAGRPLMLQFERRM